VAAQRLWLFVCFGNVANPNAHESRNLKAAQNCDNDNDRVKAAGRAFLSFVMEAGYRAVSSRSFRIQVQSLAILEAATSGG
jgi:hypothetical protein